MAILDVYLESNDYDGFIAHLFSLPGCFSRGTDEESTLQALSTAVDAYLADLARYGETVPQLTPVTFTIVERILVGDEVKDETGTRALFTPDREPVSTAEVERCLRLANHQRTDLLDLLSPLDDDVLSWRPAENAPSIAEIARHIGSADHWYSTRIIEPESVPPLSEWERIRQLPLLRFLEVERELVEQRLRSLDDEQRTCVVIPQHGTRSPGEAWTARKVLRRMLMHERDHVSEIRRLLNVRSTTPQGTD